MISLLVQTARIVPQETETLTVQHAEDKHV